MLLPPPFARVCAGQTGEENILLSPSPPQSQPHNFTIICSDPAHSLRASPRLKCILTQVDTTNDPRNFATTSLTVIVFMSFLLFCFAFEIIHVDGYTHLAYQGFPLLPDRWINFRIATSQIQ